MLDRKQIWMIFLFEFQMDVKAVETTHNINNAFGQGTANSAWRLKKFYKVDESLEDEQCSGWPLEANNDNWVIMEADLLTTMWEVAKELSVDHSMVLWHLKQIGKVKKLNKWVPPEVNEKQKSCHFDVLSSLILHNNNEPFLKWVVMCYKKSGFYYDNQWWPAQCFDQEEAPKHFPKPNVHQKKFIVTFCWSAAGLVHYSFLNCSETITSEKYTQQINEIHQKLRCLKASIGQQKRWNSSLGQCSIAHCTTNTSKVKQIELQSFALSAIFTWPLTNQLSLPQASQQIFQGKHFHK